jgi:dolichol-phosphate mannosyltransferase/undecaprenyl-phosphate 4-deoxy-4-formamido-L-arabinose transferase
LWIEYFSGDFVIMLDDDLQHPPEEIPKLIKALEENPEIDVCLGTMNPRSITGIEIWDHLL